VKTKLAVMAIGVAVALVLIAHYVALSRAGLPVDWMLYLGLPTTAAGVAFALRLADVGAGWNEQLGEAQPLLRRIFHRTKPR